jgi:hypothetical protein
VIEVRWGEVEVMKVMKVMKVMRVMRMMRMMRMMRVRKAFVVLPAPSYPFALSSSKGS